MKEKLKSYSPSKDAQLTLTEQISGSVVPISVKAYESIIHKAENNKDFKKILEQVYTRGILAADEDSKLTPEQQAFSRVNSFLSYGKAYDLDMDLLEPVFEDPYSCKCGKNLNSKQNTKATLRAKSKGRKQPNLMDHYWVEKNESNKYTKTTSIIKKVVREAHTK